MLLYSNAIYFESFCDLSSSSTSFLFLFEIFLCEAVSLYTIRQVVFFFFFFFYFSFDCIITYTYMHTIAISCTHIFIYFWTKISDWLWKKSWKIESPSRVFFFSLFRLLLFLINATNLLLCNTNVVVFVCLSCRQLVVTFFLFFFLRPIPLPIKMTYTSAAVWLFAALF